MEESRGEDAKRIGGGGGLREEEEEEEEPAWESKPSSLFPLFAVPSNPPAALPSASEAPRWLCNPSFTADVPASSGPAAAEESFPPFHDSDDEHEEGEPAGEGGAPPVKATSYDLVAASSPSSEGDRHGRREDRSEGRRRKKKRKRRSESESGRPPDDASRRSSKVPGGYGIKPAKDHYIDVRGDPDNLVYGSLYRMDVARYKIHNLSVSPNLHFQIVYRWQSRDSCIETENDIEVIDSKLKASGRYCSAKNATWLRHKGFKRAKFVGNGKSSVALQDFIPLSELQMSDERDSSRVTVKREIEESWEDEMLQKTREFNKRTRDYPHDERVWLDFAEFQDKIASTQPQKAARLQTLEKKISILEKAVELNSDNEELLLCLLNAYRRRDSGDILIERWAKILMQHSGSHKLWIEFLHVCQEDFSKFKVSGLRKAYAHAIQALCSACNRLCRQFHQAAESKQADPELVRLEIGLVDIFVNLCRFEWQSGFRELATGLFQAEIEYSLFCPSMLLSSQNKHRLFEHFWNGDGARVGEDGAVGWSGWLAQEEENRQHIVEEDAEEEIEAGGWSGWFEPSSRIEDVTRRPENLAVDDGEDGQKEDLEMEEYHEEEDVEALLKKLGIDVDAEPQTEVKDTATWNRWAKEEISRDSAQWMPVREKSESIHSGDLGRESNEGLSRVILYEDVSDYIFSLSSEEARFHLVSRFIDFFGGKISQWTCTNSASWIENTLGLEEVPDSLIEDLKDASQMATQVSCDSSHQSLKFLLGSKTDVSRKAHIMKFLRNAILLCMKIFPRNYILEEALLVAEELCFTHMNSSVGSVTHSRALAKSLLKNDRQDLLLCGIYARREAAYGNIDLARKVFDMALLSISGLPPDLQGNTSLLYFWYADMEMSSFLSMGDEICSQRSSYILSCLGSNTKYEAFKSQASSLQLLRARQGFKEQINCLRPSWARGDIREESIALICSASLLEILTSGWAAGLGIIEEVFSMVLPGRRSQSLQLESLFNYFIGLLQKHPKQQDLSRAWSSILQGLQNYPCSPKVFSVLVEVSSLYTVQHKIRRIFDEYCQRNPSVIVLLFALSFELDKAGSQHRIRGLFERALSNNTLQRSVILWRCYLAYEIHLTGNPYAARRIFYRAIHACPWSKTLWLDGFQKLSSILTAKELSDLQEVMRDKELNLRTDIYEILLEDDI